MFADSFHLWLHYLTPKHALTKLAGKLASSQHPFIKNRLIRYFLKNYAIDMQLAQIEDPYAYLSFNDFFIRHLKTELRPIAANTIVSPVDGILNQWGYAKQGTLIQAKGIDYSVGALLAEEEASFYQNCFFATFYLAPVNYHRIHMPISGKLRKMIYIPGKLFSVKPLTTRSIPDLFTRNQRLIVFFDTALGPMVMVLVGATIVGAIGTTWHGDLGPVNRIQHFNYEHQNIHLNKGEEMGYFKLGSTLILLFAEPNRFVWPAGLKENTAVEFGQGLSE